MAVSLGPGGLNLDNLTINNNAIGVVQNYNINHDTTVTTITNTTANLSGSVSIIPKATSSKILLFANFCLGNATSSGNWAAYFRRGSTDLGQYTDSNRNGGLATGQTVGSPSSEHSETHSMYYLDSPNTTSQVTYYVRLSCTDGGVIVNRVGSSSDSVWAVRGTTTMIALEITT